MLRKKVYTLIFILKNGRVLLGHKNRGYGSNKWNGFGGKLEGGESWMECARRELKEECNLDADLRHVGVLFYVSTDDVLEIVHLYTGINIKGEIMETDEMKPIRWFERSQIPYDNMLPDFKYWLDLVFKEETFFSVELLKVNDCKTQLYETYEEFLKFLQDEDLD